MTQEIAYKKILDQLTTATLLIDASLTVRYINAAAQYLLKVSGNRITGTILTDWFADAEETADMLDECVRTGQPFTRWEAAFALISGAELVVDYSISPIDLGGQHLLMEMQSREHLLRISREEDLLTQQETTRMLVRGMAHEIKNPLGGIRGAAQLLDRELTGADQKEYTRVIINEADRLRALVDRMLGPNKAPRFQSSNIHEVLERVRALLAAESRGTVDIRRDYDPSLPEFPADKEQLIQAFLNVARNAMEAAAEHRPPEKACITLRTRALRQFTIGSQRFRLVCRVDIIDNGPGIPADLLQNIFYPMVSGRANGTGLGLSITQSIVGQHGGLVECESRPGRTDFIIFLPLEHGI